MFACTNAGVGTCPSTQRSVASAIKTQESTPRHDRENRRLVFDCQDAFGKGRRKISASLIRIGDCVRSRRSLVCTFALSPLSFWLIFRKASV
jgi:hypothetical protein